LLAQDVHFHLCVRRPSSEAKALPSGDERVEIKVTWIILAVIGWAIGALVVLVLCRMAGNQDRVARRSEKTLFPYSDVTITHFGTD